MARTVPWRNKPTALVSQMIPQAKDLKLYLVSETGPTSFVFKDDHENKFKVSIGGQLNCSCGVVESDHCIHTLYVLLKKYKVSEDNPILWQASYLDNELDGLVQLKFSQKKKAPVVHRPLRRRQVQRNTEGDDGFPTVSDEDSCAICYEQLNTECYSQCQQCKNCLHSKCLKVWTKHKQENASPVTCPMCRAEFHNPMITVLKDMERWATRFLIHKGRKCAGCANVTIKGVLFHCVLCPKTDLCRMCFEGGQHPEHTKFLMKEKPESEWVVAPPRDLSTNRVPMLKTLAQQKAAEELQKAIADQQTQGIDEFLMNVYPTLKETQLTQNRQALGIVGNEIKQRFKQCCVKCGQQGSELMRRLGCGHAVHEECLRTMIRNHQFECAQDGELILQGYISAFKISVRRNPEKSTTIVEQKKQSRVLPARQQSAEHPKKGLSDMALQINGMVGNFGRRESSTSKPSKPSMKAFRIKKNTSERRELPSLMEPLIMVTGMQQGHILSRGIFRQSNI